MSRASWSKLGGGKLRRPELELARELEEARLLAGLPDVLLPARSVKC